MTIGRTVGFTVAAAVLWTAAAVAWAQEGRLSLADRVARLEQQQSAAASAASGSGVDQVNRLSELQAEVQLLRGLLEEQDFKLRELERHNRDLAMDFDSRLERLEEGASGAAGSSDSKGGVVGSVLEEPEVRDSVDADLETRGVDGSQNAATAEQVADPLAERSAYDAAFESLKNGQYAEAARRFQAFLDAYPNGEYASNAQYWMGESYYVTQNYEIALETFEGLLRQYPGSNKAPDALLKVGYSHYELKNWGKAEDILNEVIQEYPDTTVAQLAQGRLRALRLENR